MPAARYPPVPRNIDSLRPQKEETGYEQGNIDYVIAFDALHISALVLLVAVLITAVSSSRIRRLQTWYSFLLSFIVLCASNLLIVGQQLGPQPVHKLCMAQAALIYAAPVWTASSGVAFLLQIFLHAYFYIRRSSGKVLNSVFYHIIPFLLYLGIITEVVVISTRYPETVLREANGMYCHSYLQIISRISGAISAGGVVIMLILGLSTAIVLYQSWNEFKQLRVRRKSGVSVTLLIRIGLFCIVSLVALAIGSSKFLKIGFNQGPIHLVTAAVPLAASITIGLQGDILRVWMFWRPYQTTHPTLDTEAAASCSYRSRHTDIRDPHGYGFDYDLEPSMTTTANSAHRCSFIPIQEPPRVGVAY